MGAPARTLPQLQTFPQVAGAGGGKTASHEKCSVMPTRPQAYRMKKREGIHLRAGASGSWRAEDQDRREQALYER